MNKTELAIIQQLAEMDEAQQERVLSYVSVIAQENSADELTALEQLAQAAAFRERLRQKYGDHHFDNQAALDELREEESE